MNPPSSETNEINLPPPMGGERAPAGGKGEAGQALPAEQARPAGPEKASNPVAPSGSSASIPIPATPVMPIPMAPAQGQPQQSRPANPTASLQASDDSDLIEKEWVNKAKQIVERTRDDPHKQTEELTLVKVDYMKKRYNKTIKLNK